MRSASPFRARLPSPAQGWVCRIRGVFPSLRERFGRWHLYRAGGSKPTKVTKPPFCAGGKDLQVPERGARHRSPCKRGPSSPNRHAGGASAAFRHRPTRKQGLQGLRFAPGGVGKRAESPVSAGLCGMAAARTVRTWVRTRLEGLHPGQTKNGLDRKLNTGAGLQPIRWLGCRNRPTSLCAQSDASDTGCRNFP